MTTFRMDVTIGASRYQAEGPVEQVKEGYNQFLETVGAGQAVTASDPVQPALRSLFERHPDEIVSMKRLPPPPNQPGKMCMGLLFGFNSILNRPLVPAHDLLTGANRSGLPLQRVDRPLSSFLQGGAVAKAGLRRGTQYGLSPKGKQETGENLGALYKAMQREKERG